jgi:hypothetical protein
MFEDGAIGVRPLGRSTLCRAAAQGVRTSAPENATILQPERCAPFASVRLAFFRRPEMLFFLAMLALFNIPVLTGSCWRSMMFQLGAVQNGEWWRLLTHPFVHVTWYHLLLDGAAFLALYHSCSANAAIAPADKTPAAVDLRKHLRETFIDILILLRLVTCVQVNHCCNSRRDASAPGSPTTNPSEPPPAPDANIKTACSDPLANSRACLIFHP